MENQQALAKQTNDGQKSDTKANTSSAANTAGGGGGAISSNNLIPNLQNYQTVSIFKFGDKSNGPGQPPTPNLPDFLVPPHLITYETSFEINVHKIPLPLPPPQPKFIKKLLVHTESLERKTRAFLTGNFELGPNDASIRTARQKIRSLKSTILKSDDEVKHAEDTITKAQSGDFLHIFNPPIIEKPLYEFIEIPSERSEEECSEYSDRRSERAISEQTQHENMEDYYTSKYSTRSSRRRVEGKRNKTKWILFLHLKYNLISIPNIVSNNFDDDAEAKKGRYSSSNGDGDTARSRSSFSIVNRDALAKPVLKKTCKGVTIERKCTGFFKTKMIGHIKRELTEFFVLHSW